MTKKLNNQDAKKGCVLMVALLISLMIFFYFTCEGEPETEKPLTKEEIRRNYINRLIYNNGMNSVNVKLIQLIERDLNDPNSMQNLKVSFIDRDSIILVSKSFTAKNAFGGRVREEVIVAIDTLGNITEVIKWID